MFTGGGEPAFASVVPQGPRVCELNHPAGPPPPCYDISIFPEAPFIKEELEELKTTHMHATSRTQRAQ